MQKKSKFWFWTVSKLEQVKVEKSKNFNVSSWVYVLYMKCNSPLVGGTTSHDCWFVKKKNIFFVEIYLFYQMFPFYKKKINLLFSVDVFF